MNIKEFRTAIFAETDKQGAAFAELSYNENESFSVQVQNREIDEYEASSTSRVSLRVLFNEKEGIAYTEVLDDAAELVARAIDNARVIEDKDEHPVQGPQSYREIELPQDPLKHLSEAEKIDLAFKLEEAVLGEPEVVRTHAAAVSSSKSYSCLVNSLGLEAERHGEGSTVMLAPIMQRGDELQDAYAVRWDETATDIDSIVTEAVDKARKRFGGSPVPAGSYNIILSKEAGRSLLAGFWSIFSAEQSQKNLSFLTGLEEEIIAAETVTLLSDPYLATNPIAYDGEGSPTEALTVIEKGVFKTFLHNLKTANKAKRKTTGHSSALGAGISPGNFYIQAGNTVADEMPDVLENGLLIEGISGLNAGLNTVSGDFSLLAEGQLIENGKIARPVQEITIAGNYRDFLKQITHVGDDLYFGGRGGMGSPSLIVRDVKVGGR